MKRLTTLLAILMATSAVAAETELLFENSDFESGTLKNWTAEGEAFKTQPTMGDNTFARGRSNSKHQGNYWIGTYENYNGKLGTPGDRRGDDVTGALTSTPFTIKKEFINFLVGAGTHKETAVRLIVDGKIYFLATGKNNETMYQVSVDVSQFRGKDAEIVILDNETGSWGHVSADNFTASDKAVTKAINPVDAEKVVLKESSPPKKTDPSVPLSGPEQSATMRIDKEYLIVPIDNRAAKPLVRLKLGDKDVRWVYASLAATEDEIDWWAFLNVSEFKGKEVLLSISGLSEEAFKLIKQSDTVPGEENWGDEPNRPQFHFSQKVGWNNDANGMVYYKGEWHLYFQHNPVGWHWGNMSWGHAVSKDLCHWEQLPNVFHRTSFRDQAYSGGGAVDWNNAGGWKTGENDVIIVAWTSTDRGECIAYSNDKGRTFTEYEGNPIVKHRGRDPKPVWYEYGEKDEPISDEAKELGGHWVMAVFNFVPNPANSRRAFGNIAFYTSTNLKEWTEQSHADEEDYHECPELFQLPIAGKEDTRWVLFAGDARYAIGQFDGKQFTPEHKGKHQLHWGDYFASQCFSDAPEDRVVQIGWARIEMDDACFNQTFTFPTELTLHTTPDGIRMFGEPVKEIEKIHGKKHEASNKMLSDRQSVELTTSGALFDIHATFDIGTAREIGLEVDGKSAFSYDAAGQTFMNQSVKPVDGKISVQILIDRPMMETFVNKGQMVVTAGYRNDLNIESVSAFAKGGKAKLVSLEVYELDASWKEN